MPDQTVRYHRTYRLAPDNTLVEYQPEFVPQAGSVARELAGLCAAHTRLDTRLRTAEVRAQVREQPPLQAGVYPLTVTHFSVSCEHDDLDGAAELITSRLDNLRIIREVPFMRRGEVVFAIRSQGLLDPATSRAESVDALFGGGIYWRGTLTAQRYDYELLFFHSGADQCVGRMTESIDLTRKLGDLDPGLYQTEVAYHLDRESDNALPRDLRDYGSPDEIAQVHACYAASAEFAAAAARREELAPLAEHARVACAAIPGKRYYQAYAAFLEGFPGTP